MLLSRSMHPRYLSNAFVVGEGRGGAAVFVDSGAPIAPLLQFVSTHGLQPTHVLRTHSHADHIEHEGAERVKVRGRDATLIVWSPDYDGKGKAWVRFDGGEDAIVGGSAVEQ